MTRRRGRGRARDEEDGSSDEEKVLPPINEPISEAVARYQALGGKCVRCCPRPRIGCCCWLVRNACGAVGCCVDVCCCMGVVLTGIGVVLLIIYVVFWGGRVSLNLPTRVPK